MKWPIWSKVYLDRWFYESKQAAIGFAVDLDWLLGYGHCWVGTIGVGQNINDGTWHRLGYAVNLDRP